MPLPINLLFRHPLDGPAITIGDTPVPARFHNALTSTICIDKIPDQAYAGDKCIKPEEGEFIFHIA
jgi:hypothetical protein